MVSSVFWCRWVPPLAAELGGGPRRRTCPFTLWDLWIHWECLPLPGSGVAADLGRRLRSWSRCRKTMEKKRELDGGSFELEDRRLPARLGASSQPRIDGRCGGGAPPARTALRRLLRVADGRFCIFYPSRGSLCNAFPVIALVSSQKKKKTRHTYILLADVSPPLPSVAITPLPQNLSRAIPYPENKKN